MSYLAYELLSGPYVRIFLETLFRTDAEFEAFTIDYIPTVRILFSDTMSKLQKINILIEREHSQTIFQALVSHVKLCSLIGHESEKLYVNAVSKTANSLQVSLVEIETAIESIAKNKISVPWEEYNRITERELVMKKEYSPRSIDIIVENHSVAQDGRHYSIDIVLKNNTNRNAIVHGIEVHARIRRQTCSAGRNLESGQVSTINQELCLPNRDGIFRFKLERVMRIVSDDALEIHQIVYSECTDSEQTQIEQLPEFNYEERSIGGVNQRFALARNALIGHHMEYTIALLVNEESIQLERPISRNSLYLLTSRRLSSSGRKLPTQHRSPIVRWLLLASVVVKWFIRLFMSRGR